MPKPISKAVMNNIHKTVQKNKTAQATPAKQPAVKKIVTKTVHFDSAGSKKPATQSNSVKKK